MKIKIGRLNYRPYLYVEIKSDYVLVNIEIPRIHFRFEWDWDYVEMYMDKHEIKDYKKWTFLIFDKKVYLNYKHEKKSYLYKDWR